MKIMPFSIPKVWPGQLFFAVLQRCVKMDPILTRKIIMRINITSILLFFAMIQVSAKSFSQISISERNVPLQKVFSIIEKQSSYLFFYKEKEINPVKVSIQLKNASIEQVLEACLKGLPLKYEIVSNTVSISTKEKTMLDKLKGLFTALDIRGKVTDSAGLPLAGASLKLLSSGKKYNTNSNGEFVLTDVNEGEMLVVSFVGYKEVRIIISKEKPVLNIVLANDANALKEVLISTGYQKIKKELLTGAFATVDAKDLQKRTITSGNLLESLEGRLAGLVYNNRAGAAADEQLTIRGVATFNGVKTPLIVIDGFPAEISLNSINPDNIASVTVLKDAAASTIYGARAANGVIVIETKNGVAGKPKIEFGTSYSFKGAPDFGDLNLVNSEDYISIKKARALTSTASRPSATGLQFDPVTAIVYDMREGKITEADANQKLNALSAYNNMDEYTKLFYRTAFTQNHQLALSGGSESNTYRLGLNYIKSRTNETFKNGNTLTINLKDNYVISDRFELEVSGIYSHRTSDRKGNMPSYTSLVPYMHIRDENGFGLPDYNSLTATDQLNQQAMSKGLFDLRTNPYQDFINRSIHANERSLRGQLRLNTKIVKGLDLDLGGAYDYNDNLTDELLNEQQGDIRKLLNQSAALDPVSGRALYIDFPRGDVLKKNNSKLTGYTFRSQLNANYTLGKHEIYGIAGIEVRKTETNGYLNSYFGFDGQTLVSKPINLLTLSSGGSVPGFPEYNMGRAYLSTSSYYGQSNTDRRFRSYYSQATYVYDKKYILTGSARIDQSNLFGTDPKARNKPQWSLGLSWLLDQESFMKGTSDWLSQLKLRGAYGLTGNVPTSNSGRFVILDIYSLPFQVPSTTYYAIKSPENQSLRWENTKNLNLGLDFGLFNNRVNGSLEFYSKKSIQILATTQADPTIGWTSYLANTANMDNKGIELSLNVQALRQEELSWNMNLTGSLNNNKIVKVYTADANDYKNSNAVNSNAPIAGYALNTLLSYDYAGLNAKGIPTMRKKDGTITILGSPDGIFLNDLINSGTSTPRYVSGFGNTIRYKNFELYAIFMYYGGHVARVAPPIADATFPLNGAANYWKVPGDELNTNIPVLQLPSSDPNYSNLSFGKGIYKYAQQFIRKADQVNLRDIALSYYLPEAVTKSLKLSDSYFRFQVQNAWRYTFSGNDVDMDAINPVTGLVGLSTKPSFIFSFTTKF
jgi:TonB-linked SusC/RagA family outer membrane protein